MTTAKKKAAPKNAVRYIPNVFQKPGIEASAFVLGDGNKIAVAAGTFISVDGKVIAFAKNSPVTLPKAPAPGTDYTVRLSKDGKLVALEYGKPSPGRVIGGFHVALDGNIAPFSAWDEKFRPSAPDPRGMVLVNGLFWVDIYLLGKDHHINGTSKAGVEIADRLSPPAKINGEGSYANLDWFTAVEVLAQHGKKLLDFPEFTLAASGITEGLATGDDPVKTGRFEGLTSKWGVEQAAGAMWIWGRAIDTDRDTPVYGGAWGAGSVAGSRFAVWDYYGPGYSGYVVGARGRCDHLKLA